MPQPSYTSMWWRWGVESRHSSHAASLAIQIGVLPRLHHFGMGKAAGGSRSQWKVRMRRIHTGKPPTLPTPHPLHVGAHRLGTMRVLFNVAAQQCAARSTIHVAAADASRGTKKSGSATFDLGVNFAGPPSGAGPRECRWLW
jgi:hypothetical protein